MANLKTARILALAAVALAALAAVAVREALL
jgi:hypothetical protein